MTELIKIIKNKPLHSVLALGLFGLLGFFVINNFFVQSTDKLKNAVIANNFKSYQSPTVFFNNVAYAKDLDSKTKVIDSKGNPVRTKFSVSQSGGGTQVKINDAHEFTPGKYTVEIDQNGKKITQDFTWGVLAINPDKSIYKTGEKAQLSLAVLDEKGKMVCDAAVTLVIKGPNGVKTLSTNDNSIKVNPECKLKSYTEIPDYEASYMVGGEGVYEMTLTAISPNGTYTIRDYFEVKDNQPFTIQRNSATRIYPFSAYPVKIKLTAAQDFNGEIIETVPKSFKINTLDKYTKFSRIEADGDTQNIVWKVNLKKGDVVNLGYQYNAPLISPEFYLLGPLKLVNGTQTVFEESRNWQIASDAIAFVQELGTGSGAGATINVSATTSVGNVIVVGVYDATTNGSSISDSKGNSYSLDVGCTLSGTNTVDIYTARITSALTSGDTITAGAAGGGTITISAAEYSGLSTGTRLDKSACAGSSGGSTSYDSGLTATTTQADELIIGVLARTGTSTTVTPEVLSPVWNSNTQAGTIVNGWVNPTYRIVSSTGTFANKGTLAVSKPWASAVATYKMNVPVIRTPYYVQAVLNTTGLVGYWPLDEASGNFIDKTGHGYSTTSITGSPAYQQSGTLVGWGDKSVKFARTTDRGNIPHNAAFNVGDGPFSVEFWAKTTATGNIEWMFGKWDATDVGWAVGKSSTDSLQFYNKNSGQTSMSWTATTSTVGDDAWHYYVYTKASGAAPKLYSDGVSLAITNNGGVSSTIQNNSYPLAISAAGASTSNSFGGNLEHVAFYNKVLSLGEIQNHYSYGTQKFTSKYFEKTMGAPGLVGYWRLGEASGFPKDSSGNGNDANSGTATQGVAGAINADSDTANTFNGSSNAWVVPHNSNYNLGDNFTVSLWFKRAGGNGTSQFLLSKGTFGVDTTWGVFINTSNKVVLETSLTDNAIITTSTAITDTNWHQVVFTKNGSVSHAYLDGVPNETAGTNVTLTNSTTALHIGNESDNSTYFNGSLDEIALFNRDLDAGNIKAIYTTGAQSKYRAAILNTQGLNGYWRMDESSGNINDSSGNGNNSTAINGTPTYSQTGAISNDTNTAIALTGNATEFDVPHSTSLNHGDTFTIEAWIKPSDLSFGSQSYYWYYGKSAASHGWSVGVGGTGSGSDTGRLVAYQQWTGTMFAYTPTNTIAAGSWYHVVFVKNGSSRQWYVNGEAVATSGTNYTITDTTDRVGVGALGGSGATTNSFHGAEDEVAFYNVALSASQIKAHYYVGKTSGIGTGYSGGGLKLNGLIMQ